MEIIRKTNKIVKFNSLGIGEIFSYDDGCGLYLKIGKYTAFNLEKYEQIEMANNPEVSLQNFALVEQN